MFQHDPPGNDQVEPHQNAALALPVMNWNKAGGRGLRTSLRPSQPAVAHQAPAQTSHLQTADLDELSRSSTTNPMSDTGSEAVIPSGEDIQDSSIMATATSAESLMAQGYHELQKIDQNRMEIATPDATAKSLEDVDEISSSNIEELPIDGMTSNDSRTQTMQPSPQEVHLSNFLNGLDTMLEQGNQTSLEDSHIVERSTTTNVGQLGNSIQPEGYDTVIVPKTKDLLSSGETKEAIESISPATTNELSASREETTHSTTASSHSQIDNMSPSEHNETGTEEGEISDGEVAESDYSSERATDVESEGSYSPTDDPFPDDVKHYDMKEVIEIESDNDAMVTNYSDAQQTTKLDNRPEDRQPVKVIDLDPVTSSIDPVQQRTNPISKEPQTLADLTAEQLELQVRYFYITRDPTTIPETDPVRCLVCAGIGHLDISCPAQTCSHCKVQGAHFSKDCPNVTRCGRCRGLHPTERCKHKLKPQNLVLVCDLCHEKDHTEADCELVWRSSGALWKNLLPPLSVMRTCFNCGDSGHLGNDCRLRRPGKQMGSSMWSAVGLPDPLTPLTGADNNTLAPVVAKKNKHKVPNIRAKGVAAKLSKPAGSVQSLGSPFSMNSNQSAKPMLKVVKGKPIPGNIQIKGLASRTNPDSPAYSPGPVSSRYLDRKDSQDPYFRNGYSTPTSGYTQPGQYHSNDAYNDYSRDRYVDQDRGRYSRPKSRSRSPRRRDSPPRHVNYGAASRDRWNRDDYNQNGQSGGRNWQSWQHNGRN